ncbi:hyaluronidase-1-like isoform X2 [Scyliorhinus canicula]|uniref:hyaluronidase-1-like isoform X2 n=1 Tax=Scyliorhinus canicula TaxID=7830 RepID=UPI0018F3BB87|nr:hyaluronidase-1-like isoform X2 [Scyliorhinus canicula]XP_038668304.1 hyaluronidase-1-like isoform X2 [Scyliorhinus canicula]
MSKTWVKPPTRANGRCAESGEGKIEIDLTGRSSPAAAKRATAMLSGLTLLAGTLFYLSTHPAIIRGVEFKPASASPLIHNKPFIVIWNTPTAGCKTKFNVDLDLSAFDIVENENESFVGENITIFYKKKLGLYPFYTAEGTPVNGGLVQKASLSNHLTVATKDIANLLGQDFHGLAVIDWEAWRPLWDRNWGSLDIYRKESEELVRSKYPYLPESEILRIAKKEYETAAQNFMRQTLELGRALRPKGYWGFYKFPDCYNYFKEDAPNNYTGHCNEEDIPRNDQLAWLWKASRCLYPSIYIPEKLKSSNNVQKFVHYKIKEALRVAALDPASDTLPVLVYSIYTYIKTLDFLSEIDLVHTIGESAAMGASGVVLWGDLNFSRTMERCEALKLYIDKELGRYVLNTTTAAMLCSRAICRGHGRCVRKDPESRTYLQLDPKSFEILSVRSSAGSVLTARGELHSEDVQSMREQFTCQCYKGWIGTHCQEKSDS